MESSLLLTISSMSQGREHLFLINKELPLVTYEMMNLLHLERYHGGLEETTCKALMIYDGTKSIMEIFMEMNLKTYYTEHDRHL